MKKFISLVILATGTGLDLAAADGTVNLTNYDANNPILWCSFGSPPFNLPREGSFVQVLGGPIGGPLQVLASTAPGNPTVFPIIEPGFFDGGFGVVPGVAEGAQGSFQVRAWRGAPTFATAPERLSSSVFINSTGSNPPHPNIPMPAPMLLPSFVPVCIPEPSTISLGLLAAIALAFHRKIILRAVWR